jgi:hypothetical protein
MPIENDKAGATVELGPRSMALLRRIVAIGEALYGSQLPDFGRQFEDDEALVPDMGTTTRNQS